MKKKKSHVDTRERASESDTRVCALAEGTPANPLTAIVRSVNDSTKTKKVASPISETVLTNRLGCCARTDWASSCTEIATHIR